MREMAQSPFQVRRGGRIALAADVEAAGRKLAPTIFTWRAAARTTCAAQIQETLSDASRIPEDVSILMATT